MFTTMTLDQGVLREPPFTICSVAAFSVERVMAPVLVIRRHRDTVSGNTQLVTEGNPGSVGNIALWRSTRNKVSSVQYNCSA